MEGSWSKDDIRRVFVAGAKWWEFHSIGGTMWQSDQRLAEEEATKRYAFQQPVEADAILACKNEYRDGGHRSPICADCGVIMSERNR